MLRFFLPRMRPTLEYPKPNARGSDCSQSAWGLKSVVDFGLASPRMREEKRELR